MSGERYRGRHRTPGRHRVPRTRVMVPQRAGAAAVGIGVAVAAVAVPAVGVAGGSSAGGGEVVGLAFAQLTLAENVAIPRASEVSVASGVTVSRSRSRESVLELDDQTRPVARVTAATPAPVPAPTPVASPPAAVSVSGFDAAAARLGLRGYARVVYSAVRSTFGITTIGGYRPGDPRDHGTGHAVDVMITSRAQGDAVAAFVIAHAGEFHVKYVIWRQRIWFPGGTWKAMADRGGITANHYDHVHVSVKS